MYLHWHRRDLRVADNPGLARAADGTACPVFVFDPDVLEHGSPPRVAFMLDALGSLRARYRERGSDLLIARGDPVEVLPDLAADVGAEGVTYGRDYSGLAQERDPAVERALREEGLDVESFHEAVLHEPGTIRTNAGDPYSVFTYFSDKWHDREKTPPYDPPAGDDLAAVSGDPLPTLDELGFDGPEADVPAAGTEPARERLRAFCDGPIYRYADRRDYPAAECTSRLSPHLKWGTIGIREVYERTERAKEAADGEGQRESVREYQDQLAWREFYAQVLYFNPEVVTDDYKEYEHDIEWRDDPEGLQAWKDGETGYPIVDAGMRQLRTEAWMHNRVRMIVAAFLTKDLLIDWRKGYDWFRRKLVDHDTANDNGGWQWAASTGTDAQPYFRVFNPVNQCEDYDPDGEYVREYVPALRDVPTDAIHKWPNVSADRREELAPDYPDPIVDHGRARERAIETFERARGD